MDIVGRFEIIGVLVFCEIQAEAARRHRLQGVVAAPKLVDRIKLFRTGDYRPTLTLAQSILGTARVLDVWLLK